MTLSTSLKSIKSSGDQVKGIPSYPVIHVCLVAVSVISLCFWSVCQTKGDDGIEFFEKKIRPVLVEKCYQCHSGDAKKLKGGLLLEYREQILKGGDSGPAIISGKPADSLLIGSLKWDSLEMPPSGKLPDGVVKDFEHWVSIGAPWPKSEKTPIVNAATVYDWEKFRQEHWSFRPVVRPSIPTENNSEWEKNGVDYFVYKRLSSNALRPAEASAGVDLVRRIYFDLVGLPPMPQQVVEFVKKYSNNPDAAVSSLVDQLLESRHYGERWGRHWLDVARYSDGFGGFNDGSAMPDAWRYRDWVVDALNRDIPFGEFIKLQIAGDLIGDRNAAVGTGFLALGPTYRSDGGDPDSVAQSKSETLDDRIDTLTRGLMGITASCARCHDHKFDPIPQLDYYSLAGVFNNTGVHQGPIAKDEEVALYNQHQKKINDLTNRLKQLNQQFKKEKRQATAEEAGMVAELNQDIAELKKNSPPKFATAHMLRDTGSSNMKVAIRGDLRKTGAEAPRRFLRVLAGDKAVPFKNGSGRLELAEAVAAPSNPLTGRVFVNRVWQHHFGNALVRTPSNLGKLGELPTHPELLDWLVCELMDSGSIKELHRLIMNSATYRMSAQFDSDSFQNDGGNRLLWRMNPRRLDVEAWRDALLSVTGELDLVMGGPPSEDLNSRRRTLYFKTSRAGDRFGSDKLLRMFDFPIMRATVAKRPVSIVPQQYLFMLNSSFMNDRARALSARLKKSSEDPAARIQLAYRLLYGRPPREDEINLGVKFVLRQDEAKVDNWEKYCQVLLCSNEFFFLQ
jgi:hypothetical protein